MKRLRLLHLDLKTFYSYGDQVLFELVRHAFNGFAGGSAFRLEDTYPFRGVFDERVIDEINRKYDGVVIGGGGLLPRKTNASPLSGWQWNCSLEMLERLKAPIVVFAVGNPPRYAADSHNPLFRKHISQVVKQSAFCGLRSQGAVDALRDYLTPELANKVVFQPCITTISGNLLPRARYQARSDEPKKIALQLGLEGAHLDSGLLPDAIYPRLAELVARLRNDGWAVEFLGHKRSDMAFAHAHGKQLKLKSHKLFGSIDMLFKGAKTYGEFPVVMGARGHSQMIPFGLGGIPLSFSTNDKIRYFAQHVGHPEWLVDPWSETLQDQAYEAITTAWSNRNALRRDLEAGREEFLETTVQNLATIYERLGGAPVTASKRYIRPYNRLQLWKAETSYRRSYQARGEGM